VTRLAEDLPDGQGLPAAFASLGAELVDLQRRITALHGALAAGFDDAAEVELDALRAERDQRLMSWAQMALRWQLEGGEVLLGTDDEDDEDETLHGVYESDPGGSILDSVVLGPAWTQSAPVELDLVEQNERAQAVLRRLPPPAPAPEGQAWFDESNAIHQELLGVQSWADFPRTVQHALTAQFAARLRRLQDDAPAQVKVVVQLQLKKDFARLGQFSGEQQPGWVAGLGRNNSPEHGSWTADADEAWQALRRELGAKAMEAERAALNPEIALSELEALLREGAESANIRRGAIRALNAGLGPDDPRLTRILVPHLEALAGDKGLKRLRKAVRSASAATPAADTDPPEAPLPEDWALWPLVRGKVGVMVGGEPRDAARLRIESAFEFRRLTWESSYDIRGVQRLAERVRGGGIDVVLLLARFISHKTTDLLVPALKDANIHWAMVERGYGVTAVQRALERYLGERDDQ